MSERRDAIVRLLETRYENLPEPTRRAEASAGFVHRTKTRMSCPDCLANDKVSFDCETCRGRGFTEVWQERDPYAVDVVQPYGFTFDRHEQTRARDREIDIMGQQTRPAQSEKDLLAEANAHPYAWEIARRRMFKLYDYAALERAIEWWRAMFPGRTISSNIGVGYLDMVMPDPVRAPAPPPPVRVGRGPVSKAAGLSVRELRDADMRARAAAGVDPASIASEFGVSIRTVYDVCRERAA